MTPDRLPDTRQAASGIARPWRERWFAGLTWNGIGLIMLICAINATRRTIRSFGDDTFFVWLIQTVQTVGMGLIVAVPVALAVVATYNLAPRRATLRYPALALAVAVSCMAGVAMQIVVEAAFQCGGFIETCFREPFGEPIIATFRRSYVRYGSLCALFTVVFVFVRVAEESAEGAQDAERERARFAQRMQEARLRMLQAQIEPHFLFNTLANVRRLYQTDSAEAANMLDNLMRYFAVALPQMRATDSTLGREAALTESYLEIQRIRMGRRLAFDIDIAEPLREAPVPPMMLLTLVENAIKHGLAPLPEGGTVRVSASVDGHELRVRVADTGRGFTHSSGGGTGLANIRARLAGLYGAGGRLTLALNTPRGVIATIAVPLSWARSAAGAP